MNSKDLRINFIMNWFHCSRSEAKRRVEQEDNEEMLENLKDKKMGYSIINQADNELAVCNCNGVAFKVGENVRHICHLTIFKISQFVIGRLGVFVVGENNSHTYSIDSIIHVEPEEMLYPEGIVEFHNDAYIWRRQQTDESYQKWVSDSLRMGFKIRSVKNSFDELLEVGDNVIYQAYNPINDLIVSAGVIKKFEIHNTHIYVFLNDMKFGMDITLVRPFHVYVTLPDIDNFKYIPRKILREIVERHNAKHPGDAFVIYPSQESCQNECDKLNSM